MARELDIIKLIIRLLEAVTIQSRYSHGDGGGSRSWRSRWAVDCRASGRRPGWTRTVPVDGRGPGGGRSRAAGRVRWTVGQVVTVVAVGGPSHGTPG